MKKYILITDKNEFYAIDHNSGGYDYWSSSLSNAKLFNSIEEVNNAILTFKIGEEVVMSDGTKSPNRMIHSALGLNNTKLRDTGLLYISEIKFDPVEIINICGEIKKPKGIKHSY